MSTPRPGRRARLGLAAVVLFLGPVAATARGQLGLLVGGVGPVNRSMGGASTAAPIDSPGALYWNPATIGSLGRNEMDFGNGFLVPRTSITSTVNPGALGGGQPPVPLRGRTGGNNGVFILPAFGLVFTPDESPFTYGLGVYEIGGFGVNYPISPYNPILNPQAPYGRGVGPLYTQLQLFQFSPSLSVRLSDELSVGFAGNIDYGFLNANPALFSQPALTGSPTGGLAGTYPNATQGRARFGGGFQLGVYWTPEGDWNFGASYKSTQWFEPYTYNSVNPTNGHPASPKFTLDIPSTVSLGAAYKGIDKVLWATDVRYLDYRNTDGFRSGGYAANGALRGLGWQGIFALGTGVQYQATDALSLRAGYTFSMDPESPSVASVNLGSPTIIMHSVSAGASYNVTQALKVSVAYAHDFQNSVSGPIVQPGLGAVPGTSVRNAATADTVYVGSSVSF